MEGELFSEVEALGKRLGLPGGFFAQLIKEDDWSFVIKLNALVEATCTDALAVRLHNPELADSLATLDLGHSKHGKVALLRKLEAISAEQAGLLRLLLELRNSLTHNVSQVGFSFSAYLSGLDSNQRAKFVDRVGHGMKPIVGGAPKETIILENPKLALWITVADALACLHLAHDVAELRLQTLALERLGIRIGEQSAP